MNRVKFLVFALALTPTAVFAQALAGTSYSSQPTQVQGKRVSAPTAGIDLSCLNPAQRVLQSMMVQVQLAGIQGDEVNPTSRRIVIGMNYVMRISLTPQQQAIVDPQVWRTRWELPKEWDRVKNSGSAVSALANLSPAQDQSIGRLARFRGGNWHAFAEAVGPNPTPARRVAVMWEQQQGLLDQVRRELNAAQRAEWDNLLRKFRAEMQAAVGALP